MASDSFRVFSPDSQCRGKTPYTSKQDAKRAVKRSESYWGDRLCAYRCPHCSTDSQSRFHVGHKPAPVRLNKEA